MSNLRISHDEIASDLIPYGQADLIISVEPMESLRYLPFISSDGWVITSTEPLVNIPNYPDLEKVMEAVAAVPHHVALDANTIAKDAGAAKAANMVVLGAAAPFLGMSFESLQKAVSFIFRNKGEEVINMNLKALQAGFDVTTRQIS